MRRLIGGLVLFWGFFGNIDGAECCGLWPSAAGAMGLAAAATPLLGFCLQLLLLFLQGLVCGRWCWICSVAVDVGLCYGTCI